MPVKVAEKQPAKETFHHYGKVGIAERLSDSFKKMEEKEVDTTFSARNGTPVRVFGFRNRKGIVISGDAFIDIKKNTATIHLEKAFNDSLRAHTELYFVTDIARKKMNLLRGTKEFQNFASVLDFFENQKIHIRDGGVISGTTELYVISTKRKYEIALRVKELEKYYAPKEAVEKILSEFKTTRGFIITQLRQHRLDDEAEILNEMILKKIPKTHEFDYLVSKWLKEPPKNVTELKADLGSYKPTEVKKFVEKAVEAEEKDVRKVEEDMGWYKERIGKPSGRGGVFDAQREQYIHDLLKDMRMKLEKKTSELNNLRKAYAMLGS